MNIYEMYVEHWKRPGFWIRRTTWGNTIAKVIEVGEFAGRAPYYGNPQVIAVVYDMQTGDVKDKWFEVPAAGTYKTWRWVHPPEWSGEGAFDAAAGRVVLNVPFEENRRASRMGVRWSDLLGAWWISYEDTKALAKAKERGYLDPPPPLGSIFLGFMSYAGWRRRPGLSGRRTPSCGHCQSPSLRRSRIW